jgi:mono/diheme cytochrome c family protein
MKRLVVCFTVALSILPTPFAFSEEREYKPQELQQGKQLYEEHCQSCHGVNGEGTANWKERDENGNFPPPPLNGTAHTWHHSVPVLFRTISEGTGKLGGTMPAWKDKLSEEQILLIINWITALWPDEVYKTWLEQISSQ